MGLEIDSTKIEINLGPLTDAELAVDTAELAGANALRKVSLSVLAGNTAVDGANADVATDEAMASETLPTPVTRESLAKQLTAAYTAYEKIGTLLNGGRDKEEHVEIADRETAAKELKTWLTDEKLAYVTTAMEADPELRYTLVATPNIVANADEIIDFAREFGKDQPYPTNVWSDFYGKFTPEQLSGTDPSNRNSIKFSLIPNKLDPSMHGGFAHQRDCLARIQADNPFIGAPSVLDAVVFWNTLRAAGGSLSVEAVFEGVYIRHFDLPEKLIDDDDSDGYRGVPCSYIRGGGRPYLDVSRDVSIHARISV